MNPTAFLTRPHRLLFGLFGLALIAAACGSDDDASSEPAVAFDGPQGSVTLVAADDVEFVEISPFARFGPAQGDFTAGAHGTFGIFGAGLGSPPHTHTGAYYAVVLEGGAMNNPFGTESEPPTLGPGSFWSVPGDEQHVTACLDPNAECRFFFHAQSAFDFAPLDATTEERSSAAQAVPAAELTFEALAPYGGAATLWGDPDDGAHGMIVRLAGGATTGLLAHRNAFSLVPLTGVVSIESADASLESNPGSVLEVGANTVLSMGCEGADGCTLYLFSDAPLEIRS